MRFSYGSKVQMVVFSFKKAFNNLFVFRTYKSDVKRNDENTSKQGVVILSILDTYK